MRQVFRKTDVLLPKESVDMQKWAVIACDQFTSDQQFWTRVKETVGEAPSTLHMILPEAMLAYSDLIAFGLLLIIGVQMIYGSVSKNRNLSDNPPEDKPAALPELLILSLATSIDALAAGTSLALIDVNILAAAAVIGAVAFLMSTAGALLGRKAAGLTARSEMLGGAVLIAIAVRILVY